MTKLAHSYSALKMFSNCPKRYYYQRIARVVQDTGSEASLYGERVHKSIENYILGTEPLPDYLDPLRPTITALSNMPYARMLPEHEITLTREFRPTGWWDDDAWLRFKLDVMIHHDNYAAVVDWKTGKRRPDFWQLELFAFAVMTADPSIERVATAFVWIRDMACDTQTFSRTEHYDGIKLRLLQDIARIERALESDVWPVKPSGLCRFCPAQSICEAA
jgi:CRISPR/Cas system-associated exonuclease Cas4 (RecB family)